MRTRKASLTHLLAALALVACKQGGGAGDEDASPAAELAPLAQVEAAITDVNAALPADLAGVIEFQAAELEEGDLAGAVPAGWESGSIPWNLRPPDDADLGFHTQYGVGFGCAGRCEPKAWKDELADTEFGQYLASDAFEVLRDESLRPSGRLVVARRGDTTYIAAAWWREGASRYAFCRATLDGRAATAADAFERACRASRFQL